MKIDIMISPKQKRFIMSDADEVLFGGAAGGGKTHGQLIDTLLYALKYPKSKQLILRRTFAELEKSIIRSAYGVFPAGEWRYNASTHTVRFKNGSIVDFGYCAREKDVYQYQSAEYDVIRFDELTHFTEFQYTYLMSRIRGANDFPKQIKCSTNPGHVGHAWVKKRFIDPVPPGVVNQLGTGTRVFIPSLIDDNKFLKRKDPGYKARLLNLPAREQKALLHGQWDLFEGQYFTEFDRNVHVIKPFDIPSHWRRYRSIDYGLDMYACLWTAISPDGCAYVYRELCEPDLTIGEAAKKTVDMTERGESIYMTLAPPDLFGRTQETGKTKNTLFAAGGVRLTKTSNDRETGWLTIKEMLTPSGKDGSPRLYIFDTCRRLITDLPALNVDPKKPSDCATEPHDCTHAPDALRALAIYHFRPQLAEKERNRAIWTQDMYEDYYAATSQAERDYIIAKYGDPF